MALSPEALHFIAKHNLDLILDISEFEIQDKSKANAFTKFLTCAQASWFGVQCMTRLVQCLSISLLEVNTAVHAACALLLYFFFWWKKPLNVDEPTLSAHPNFPAWGALMSLCDMKKTYDLAFSNKLEREQIFRGWHVTT